MSKNAQFIYGGGGDVTLYDATNGWFNLGYLQELVITAEPAKVPTVRDQQFQFFTMYKLMVKQLQTDAAMVAELVSRRTVLQTIYIAGAGKLFTFSNMLISYAPMNPFNASEAHTIDLLCQTGVEPDQQENLMGSAGQFETDGGSGIASGWTQSGTLAAKSITTSYLSGGGNAQALEIDVTDYNAAIYKDIIAPFVSPMKIIFSAYFKAVASSQFRLTIKTLDTSGGTLNTYDKAISMTLNEETRQTHPLIINEGEIVKTIEIMIRGNGSSSANLIIDNAQLEFGGLRDFRST